MKTWWCAIDTHWISYDELKERHVVAQGWPDLGDMTRLLGLIPDRRDDFNAELLKHGDEVFGHSSRWRDRDRQLDRAPRVFWTLLSLEAGDLVVGLEGATVRGVCQLEKSARETYQYSEVYHYGHSVGHPVDWVDWDEARFGFELVPPARGVHGIGELEKQKEQLIHAWTGLEKIGS